MILKYQKINCILCGKEFNSQGSHLRQHNITNKCYYDKYLKTDDEGKCLVCGEPTRYYSMKYGYKPYCSDKCAANSDILINNKKQTCLEKYGCEYSFQSENNKIKSKKTKLLKYGDENYVNTEKAQQTCLTKYGVKHPAQSTDIDCTSHRITYNGLNFDSIWEFKYYKYLVDNNIEFTYKPKISLEFEYDGVIRKYKPDFIVDGKITEIKGDHFF